MTDVEEEYKLHKPGDEAANIELVERTEKTSSLNIFVREGARNGHARVLAACLAKGASPDGTASLKARDSKDAILRSFNPDQATAVRDGGAGGMPGAIFVMNPTKTHPLLYALDKQSPECVKLLLETGCDPNAGPERAMSPLFVVGDSPHSGPSFDRGFVFSREAALDMVRLVLAHGCDVHAERHDRQTPLFSLTKSGLHEAMEALVERGADTEVGPGPPDGSFMTTPFALACDVWRAPGELSLRASAAEKCATVRELIRIGVQLVPTPSAADFHGRGQLPESHLRDAAVQAPAPVVDGTFDAAPMPSIKLMKAAIKQAGLSVADLFEKPDVVKRYRLARRKNAPADYAAEYLRLADLVRFLGDNGGDDASATVAARKAAREPLIARFEETRPPLF